MYDVVIIGAGPAGLAASIYAKRAGLSAVTVEQSTMSGGQVLTTYEVDNYPGFRESTDLIWECASGSMRTGFPVNFRRQRCSVWKKAEMDILSPPPRAN